MSEVESTPTTARLPVERARAGTRAPQAALAPTAPAAGRTLQLARSAALALQHLQYRLARVGAAGLAGAGGLIAAALVLAAIVLPQLSSISRLDAQIATVQHGGAAPRPLQGIARLVSSLPTRQQVPLIVGQVLEQAQKAGVSLDTGRYSYSSPKAGQLGRYELEFPVKAAYPNIRDFIDRTLIAVPAAGLDKLRVERKAVGDTVVNAEVRFVVFVRGES
jgi:hypothetical protein